MRRALLKEALTGTVSTRRLRNNLNMTVHRETIRLVLRMGSKFRFTKAIQTLQITTRHKNFRVDWAETHGSYSDVKWREVFFSDEKKFNLDGPECMAYYCHDVRINKRVRISRLMGGGSVMNWVPISSFGKSKIAILHGKRMQTPIVRFWKIICTL